MAQPEIDPALTPSSAPREPDSSSSPSRLRLPRLQEAGLVVVIVAICLLLTFVGGNITIRGHVVNNFFRPDNLLPNVLTPMSWMAIMAVGVTCVVVAGGIDISVGSIFGLSALSCAAVLQTMGENASAWKVLPVAILVPCGVGLICGLINGGLVVGLRMHPFIVTLATMSIFRGVALNSVKSGSLPTSGNVLPIAFTDNLLMYTMKYAPPGKLPVNLQPVPMLAMLIVAIVGAVYLGLTIMGRENYAVGGNEEAARFSGIPIGWVKLRVYAISGLCAGIAGMINCGYYGSAATNTGEGYELMVIAAVAVGGASLSGGRGTALGAVLGALIIQLIENGIFVLKQINLGLFQIQLSKEYSKIIVGIAILLAVTVDQLSEHFRRRRARGRGTV